MGKIIKFETMNLVSDDVLNEKLREALISTRYNMGMIEDYTPNFTPFGRAYISLLRELTSDTISRDYVEEKLRIMFEEE